jgi:uncharacterized protein YhaN
MMRIESVTAHAFGPLVGETLQFAPGMTVIVGDNESAKSSWHAAIYSALCGRRRGKGRATKDEQRFADLHRPWDGGQWLVSAVVRLDDGRQIELWQDLDGKVDCRATDLALGRDVSGEVMHEGTPDASRWLGLDRRSFLATACVYQAQLLGVLDEADGLQSHLERSAATAGADATATEALERIEAFRAEYVGRDDARSTRPLRVATKSIHSSRQALEQAQRAHEDYLRTLEHVEQLRHEAKEAEDCVALYEAAASFNLANDLRKRYRRAVELDRTFAGVPPEATQTDALSDKVIRALEAQRGRPEPVELHGLSAAELKEQIAHLPPMPEGPQSVDPEIQQAHDKLRDSEMALEAHEATKPTPPETSLPVVDTAEVLELAHALEQDSPTVDPAVAAQVQRVADRIRMLEAARRRSTLFLAPGIFIVAAGVVAIAMGIRSFAFLTPIALIGIVLIAVGALKRKTGSLAAARAELLEFKAQDANARAATAKVVEVRKRAESRCDELGISPVPASLRALVGQIAHNDTYMNQIGSWEERRTALSTAHHDAMKRLRSALIDVGASVGEDLMDAYVVYSSQCGERAKVAHEAGQRSGLEAQLRDRMQSESMAASVASARQAADDQVLEAARTCGFSPKSAEEAVTLLEAWEQHRDEERHDLESRHKQWAELEALLRGQTIDDLAEALSATENDLQVRAKRFDMSEIASLASQDAASHLSALREEAKEALGKLATEEGALGELARRLPSVADAEETLAHSEVELTRVRELDQTLLATSEFLARAQERVQRDVAPLLASTLRQWLPEVTAGRYVDATVDPATLEAQVCGINRRWRRADRLSQGTSEQVYLLLRVTLSRHLTGNNGVCPLLLDDVTVQADATRTVKILELLHKLSAEQQVIVFTQERIVAEWARLNLRESTDRMIELTMVDME